MRQLPPSICGALASKDELLLPLLEEVAETGHGQPGGGVWSHARLLESQLLHDFGWPQSEPAADAGVQLVPTL